MSENENEGPIDDQKQKTKLGRGGRAKPGPNQVNSLVTAGGKNNYGTNDTLELLKKISSRAVEMKLDDVLIAVKTVDNLCKYGGCKAKTSLVGQNCEFCRKRFCFKHGLPEVHGCGEAAKKSERNKFLHPKPFKIMRKDEELAQARKKLDSKLRDMRVCRMQQSAGKNSRENGNIGGKKSKTYKDNNKNE